MVSDEAIMKNFHDLISPTSEQYYRIAHLIHIQYVPIAFRTEKLIKSVLEQDFVKKL
uniref:Uncharacterized protein n=1 Tax=viral metagenome TaxID=1070528 RepID=A0A6C0J8E4_9ZZZZ